MKRYLLFLLLGLSVLSGRGQSTADYYRLPDRSHQYDRLLMRYGGPQVRDRWYMALDGFVRTDRARLDNSFNGLIESKRVTKAGWGATIGWSYRERWAVEGGYARMPVHTKVSIRNGAYPLVFRYNNDKNAVFLRAKRLVLSTSGPWLRSGFWLSGGLWVVPNNRQEDGSFSLIGYGKRREVVDTLKLTSRTNSSRQVATMAELGAEYNVRLSNTLDLGFSVRRFWGLSNSVTTDVDYTINKGIAQQAQLQGTGTGMSYGLTLRYTYAIRRNQADVLEVQGKSKQRIR